MLTEEEFADLGELFPQIYRNLGILLAERLAHTNRLVAKRAPGRLVVLANDGAPPLLGCALACSLAWHTRERTLYVALRSDPNPDLKSLAKAARDRTGLDARRGIAILHVEGPKGRYAPNALYETLIEPLRPLPEHHHRGRRRLRTAARDRNDSAAPGRGRPAASRRTASSASAAGPADRAACARTTTGSCTVRELAEEDLRAMRSGVLPSSTAAGDALGWAARDLTGLKVGLALGAGSIRGYAHVGVIESLHRAGVPIDYIAGTSIGSPSLASTHWVGDRRRSPPRSTSSARTCSS